MLEEIRAELLDLRDDGYLAFNKKTNPELKNSLGVRIPEQRKIAKRIAKSDFWQYLDAEPKEYYEEIMIEGIVIATAPMSTMERFDYLANFVPKIHDWATCDCVAASFRIKDSEREEYWDLIMRYQKSTAEFEVRFMLVMILDHFILPEYWPRIIEILENLPSDAHYVEMAAAWLISVMMVKERENTLKYLSGKNNLSDFVQNKAISKCRESYRVSGEDKELLKTLRR